MKDKKISKSIFIYFLNLKNIHLPFFYIFYFKIFNFKEKLF